MIGPVAHVVFADYESNQTVAEIDTAVVPRAGEFVKIGDQTRKVYDIEHIIERSYPALAHLAEARHLARIVVRLC